MIVPDFKNSIPVFPGRPPFASDDEKLSPGTPTRTEVNDGVLRLSGITSPVLSFFPATGKGPHPALLVCPGGGYSYVTWNSEGYDIAAFLNTIGCSAFVLNYRCPARRQAAHADAARAMRLIRSRAAEFDIRPDKLGAIGFSAGAHLCATISAPADETPYPPIDETDKLPYRPDFTLLIYPAYLVAADSLALNPEFLVDSRTPPSFLAQTQDDGIRVENALGWFAAMKQAGVKAELHIWPEGGHGYGIRRTGNPCMNWHLLAAEWIRRQTGLL